jgi:hypothetical protein
LCRRVGRNRMVPILPPFKKIPTEHPRIHPLALLSLPPTCGCLRSTASALPRKRHSAVRDLCQLAPQA